MKSVTTIPTIYSFPGPGVSFSFILPPSSTIPISHRLITVNINYSFSTPPIMVATPLMPTPLSQFKMLRKLNLDDDSRHNLCLLADCAQPGFLVSGNSGLEEEMKSLAEKDNSGADKLLTQSCNHFFPFNSDLLTHSTGKSVASVFFTQNNTRRISFWRKMKISMDENASIWEGMMLTWFICYVKLLLSLTLWKSMLRLMNMLLLLLLMPFNGRRRHCVMSFGRVEKEETQTGMEMSVSDLEVLVRREMAIQRVREDKDGIDKTTREYSLFVTPRGVTLFTQSWTPVSGENKGLVILLHGLNEHSSRYNSFAKQLNANGFKVYGLDWIGHGGSDGQHGYVHNLDDVVLDVKAFLDEVLSHNDGSPCFCFGHSTGGAILLKAALDPKIGSKINGLILTSPAIGVQPSHPIYSILAPIMSILLPRYQCGAANKKGAVVSRDPDALVEKYSDPLVYTGSLRVRTGYEILRTTKYLQENLRKIEVPFLVLHGTADVITNPSDSEKLYMEASSTDKTMKLYEGLLHDLLFEPEKETIINDIMEWLIQRTHA